VTHNKTLIIGEARVIGTDGPPLDAVPGPAENTVVEVWGPMSLDSKAANGTARAVLSAGFPVILGGPFYLDQSTPHGWCNTTQYAANKVSGLQVQPV
jgi:hypothetical protein